MLLLVAIGVFNVWDDDGWLVLFVTDVDEDEDNFDWFEEEEEEDDDEDEDDDAGGVSSRTPPAIIGVGVFSSFIDNFDMDVVDSPTSVLICLSDANTVLASGVDEDESIDLSLLLLLLFFLLSLFVVIGVFFFFYLTIDETIF